MREQFNLFTPDKKEDAIKTKDLLNLQQFYYRIYLILHEVILKACYCHFHNKINVSDTNDFNANINKN